MPEHIGEPPDLFPAPVPQGPSSLGVNETTGAWCKPGRSCRPAWKSRSLSARRRTPGHPAPVGLTGPISGGSVLCVNPTWPGAALRTHPGGSRARGSVHAAPPREALARVGDAAPSFLPLSLGSPLSQRRQQRVTALRGRRPRTRAPGPSVCQTRPQTSVRLRDSFRRLPAPRVWKWGCCVPLRLGARHSCSLNACQRPRFLHEHLSVPFAFFLFPRYLPCPGSRPRHPARVSRLEVAAVKSVYISTQGLSVFAIPSRYSSESAAS